MRFRKKPVVIEAVRNLYDTEVEAFCGAENRNVGWGRNTRTGVASITTLEGTMTAQPGDWIIRGVKGELYPCKPDIFEATYERLEVYDEG